MQQQRDILAHLGYNTSMQVKGPYHDKSTGAWRIRWRDENGKLVQKSSIDKSKIEALKRELTGSTPTSPATLPEIPAYNSTAAWWDRRGGELATLLLQAVASGDEGRIDLATKATRAWAPLAHAGHRFLDRVDLERQVAEMQGYIEEIRQARKHGTGTQGRTVHLDHDGGPETVSLDEPN